MDIRQYRPKQLPYHFILFYDVLGTHLPVIKHAFSGKAEDNAILTYCYLDRQCGLSYKTICCAYRDGEEKVSYNIPEERSTDFTIREGGILGQAVIISDDEIPDKLREEAEQIKKGYGYYPNMCNIDEEDPFSAFQHPSYPKDVLVWFFSENHDLEQMWVTELDRTEKGVIIGKLLNEPNSKSMGVHEGDPVKVILTKLGEDRMEPVALLPWMQ